VIRQRSERKKIFTPDIWKSGGTIFFLRGGTSNQITVSIEYTEICYLAVALINVIGLYYSIINQ